MHIAKMQSQFMRDLNQTVFPICSVNDFLQKKYKYIKLKKYNLLNILLKYIPTI